MAVTTQPDPYALMTQQAQAMWALGDFARAAAEQVVVAELLCRAVDIHPGEHVLDVAAGSGNAALAAARRGAAVIATDFAPQLLQAAAWRARAEGLPLETQEADAQALPFADGAFDVVLSTFGVMFAPGLRGDDFGTAFEPVRQMIGIDRLPEPERSRVAARQRICQHLVLGYWDGMLRTTPAQLQARIDTTVTAIRAPFPGRVRARPRRAGGTAFARFLPSAQAEEWPGRGHLVHFAEPDRFAGRLAAFASQCFRAGQPDRPTATSWSST